MKRFEVRSDKDGEIAIQAVAKMDPFEAFQIATGHIADGDYRGALTLLERASSLMSGDSDFDALLDACRTKCAS